MGISARIVTSGREKGMLKKIKHIYRKYRRRWDYSRLSPEWKRKFKNIGIDPERLERLEREGRII
jgi:hypothetical protein